LIRPFESDLIHRLNPFVQGTDRNVTRCNTSSDAVLFRLSAHTCCSGSAGAVASWRCRIPVSSRTGILGRGDRQHPQMRQETRPASSQPHRCRLPQQRRDFPVSSDRLTFRADSPLHPNICFQLARRL
jgi:hypothetical protein